jgi:hypothetical protein
MSSKALCTLVRAAAAAAALCGLVLCLYVFPSRLGPFSLGCGLPNPGERPLLPLLFLWAVSAPCFVILVYVWKVSSAIKRETVFTLKTAGWIKISAILLLADVGFFFAGNICLLFFEIISAEILLISILISIFAIFFALLAAVLSRYITKAAELQDESEGTI